MPYVICNSYPYHMGFKKFQMFLNMKLFTFYFKKRVLAEIHCSMKVYFIYFYFSIFCNIISKSDNFERSNVSWHIYSGGPFFKQVIIPQLTLLYSNIKLLKHDYG